MANDEKYNRDCADSFVYSYGGRTLGKSIYNRIMLESITAEAKKNMQKVFDLVSIDESETILASPTVVHLPKPKKTAQWLQKRYGRK
jgi:hypothetical protein